MKIRVDYKQTIQFSNNLRGFTREFRSWLRNFLRQEANHFIQTVRKRTPVRTGRLRSAWRLESLSWRGNALTAQFVNDAYDGYANYASFVEEGHAKPYRAGAGPGSGDWVAGRFMLRYTEREMMRRIPPRLKSQLRSLFRKYKLG